MTRNEWELLFIEATNSLREQVFVPYDTGNMKYNAIKGIWINENQYRIYIDEAVAPYVFFTNEPWTNRKGSNPNEGWVEKMVDYVATYIAQRVGGRLER